LDYTTFKLLQVQAEYKAAVTMGVSHRLYKGIDCNETRG